MLNASGCLHYPPAPLLLHVGKCNWGQNHTRVLNVAQIKLVEDLKVNKQSFFVSVVSSVHSSADNVFLDISFIQMHYYQHVQKNLLFFPLLEIRSSLIQELDQLLPEMRGNRNRLRRSDPTG